MKARSRQQALGRASLPRRLLALITALLIGFSTAPTHADGPQTEKKKLKALNEKISQLQKELLNQSKQQKDENARLREVEIHSGQLKEKIRTTETDLNRLNKSLQQLYQQRDTLNESKQSQQTLMVQHINAAFRMGREQKIKLLLNEQNPTHLNRLLKFHDYFLQARAQKITAYLATLKELQSLENSIATNQTALEQQRSNLLQQQNQLKIQIAQRQTTLNKIKKNISSNKTQLTKMNDERQALAKIITALQKAIAELAPTSPKKPFRTQKGKLPWPTTGKLNKKFGAIRKADIRWNGILIKASEGTPVNAIHHGRVIFSDYLRGHGLLLIIDHGKGYMSLYAHNQILLKESGEWVNSKEIISRVGNTGGLDTSALYFEIRYNGKPDNPSKWLKRK